MTEPKAPQPPPPPIVVRLSVANNALLEVPKHETHHRGTNWMAVIDVDGTLPGGLSRRWLPKGKGECFYLIEQLALFDPVEFGADYTTTHGKRNRTRWYGVVTAITDGCIMLEECATGAKAVLRARDARTSPTDRVKALDAKRDDLVQQAAKLEAEIAELRGWTPPPTAEATDTILE